MQPLPPKEALSRLGMSSHLSDSSNTRIWVGFNAFSVKLIKIMTYDKIWMKQIKEHIYEWAKFWIRFLVTLNCQDDNTFIFVTYHYLNEFNPRCSESNPNPSIWRIRKMRWHTKSRQGLLGREGLQQMKKFELWRANEFERRTDSWLYI